MHLYFCCVWVDVSEERVHSLWFTKGKLAFSMLVQMANCYQSFLQHCLQVARRFMWKYITAWFHSKGQLLLPGFIKSCPPSKQYLSSTSTGSPQETVVITAPLKCFLSKCMFYVVWTCFIGRIARVGYSAWNNLLHIVEAGKKNINYLKCLSPINTSLPLFSEESFSHYKRLGRSITVK